MISAAEYLADPCGTLSIPYWKARGISVPPGVKIVHDSEFSEGLLDRYTDTPYFRLIHRLRDIPGFCVPDVVCRTIGPDYTGELADMINICYAHSGIRVFDGDVKGWMDSAAYCPGLWIGAFGRGGCPVLSSAHLTGRRERLLLSGSKCCLHIGGGGSRRLWSARLWRGYGGLQVLQPSRENAAMLPLLRGSTADVALQAGTCGIFCGRFPIAAEATDKHR